MRGEGWWQRQWGVGGLWGYARAAFPPPRCRGRQGVAWGALLQALQLAVRRVARAGQQCPRCSPPALLAPFPQHRVERAAGVGQQQQQPLLQQPKRVQALWSAAWARGSAARQSCEGQGPPRRNRARKVVSPSPHPPTGGCCVSKFFISLKSRCALRILQVTAGYILACCLCWAPCPHPGFPHGH